MKKEIIDELEGLSPMLAQHKKTASSGGFRLPDGYFEQLTDRVAAQIHFEAAPFGAPQKATPRPVASWLQNSLLSWQRGVIAFGCVAVATTLGWFFLQKNNTTPLAETATTALTSVEIRSYIDENLKDFDEQTILKIGIGEADLGNFDTKLDETDLELYLNEALEGATDADLAKLAAPDPS